MGVYPRPRGEYIAAILDFFIERGLPPPTRGIRSAGEQWLIQCRSTPAHAGNTSPAAAHRIRAPVYPRPRGEYECAMTPLGSRPGLPPPTRGILHRLYQAQDGRGSTPAHAGNTHVYKNRPVNAEVYPRPRGEYHRNIQQNNAGSGLPPPTRGIHSSQSIASAPSGSTPAHAGNTLCLRHLVLSLRVYPRPRGEYACAALSPATFVGLPPPTRGIRVGNGRRAARVGSTPAHAGNTRAQALFGFALRVYPRPRGEYAGNRRKTQARRGLPPPTRGILTSAPPPAPHIGSTPAHAGNTGAPPRISRTSRVYPRPRGEYPRCAATPLFANGLPPPTRGIPPLSPSPSL